MGGLVEILCCFQISSISLPRKYCPHYTGVAQVPWFPMALPFRATPGTHPAPGLAHQPSVCDLIPVLGGSLARCLCPMVLVHGTGTPWWFHLPWVSVVRSWLPQCLPTSPLGWVERPWPATVKWQRSPLVSLAFHPWSPGFPGCSCVDASGSVLFC